MNRRRIILAFVFVAAALTTAACDEGQSAWGLSEPARGLEPVEQGRFALIEIGVDSSTGATDPAVDIAGQFVDYSGPDDVWARHALDLWLPEIEANGGLDACRLMLDHLENPPVGVADYRISLLDAGAISMARDQRHELAIHYVPGLHDYLGGQLYARGEETVAYLPGAAYLFEGRGAADVDPFTVAVTAPPAMQITAVDGESHDPSLERPLPTNRDLVVEWDAADGDVVYLDLYDDSTSAAPVLSCATTDDGRYEIPEDALRAVTEAAPQAALRLVAKRARSAEFELEGFDWSRVVFTASDHVWLTP